MVFEYMDHDLTGLAGAPPGRHTASGMRLPADAARGDRAPGRQVHHGEHQVLHEAVRPLPRLSAPSLLRGAHTRARTLRLLQGLHYCHKNNILHRDIKGSNILIDNAGVVKIADFGLARSYAGQESTNPLTNRVITLWYRPPELLLGSTKYGPEVDMWSVGCIFAELVMGKPILPGKNEMEQVDLIFRLCGTPTEEVWSGCTKLPWFHMFKPEKPHRRRLLEHLARAPADVQDLCDKLLTLDPAKRLRADSAILHDFFYNEPQPAAPQQHYESSHEFQTKKRRQELRAKAEAEAAAKRAHTDAGAMSGAGGRAQMPYQHGSHAAGSHAPSGGMHPYAMHGAGAAGAAPSGYGGVYGGAPASAGMGFSAQPRAGAPPAGPPAAGARPHDYRAAVTGQPPRGPDGRPLPPAGAAGPPRGPDGRPLPPGASRPPPR
jgi:cyclin-dependent kinase 12/13